MNESPLLWLPKIKDILIEPDLVPRVRVAGWFKLEAIGLDGRVRPLAEFPNLITNGGLDQLGNSAQGGGPWNTCAVGSGNTAPAITDTTLQSIVASTTTDFSDNGLGTAQSTPPYFGTGIKTWQFAVGAAAGNLSEVGVGQTATALFSRALILDGGGSPTTITVLSNEALNVTYTLNQYPPTADVTGSITLNGVSYAYTIRAANVTATAWGGGPGGFTGMALDAGSTFNGAIGAITGQPGVVTGTPQTGGFSSITTASYTVGTYTRQATVQADINSSNLGGGGIGAMLLTWGNGRGSGGSSADNRGQYQMGFTPKIPKDNTMVLTLTVQVGWTRGP
jgi:hypothetical protein